MRAVVVAHGDVLPSDRALIGPRDFVVAADGGALALERWKLLPHLVVGDMDSLGDAGVERFARQGAGVAKFSADKNESDLELAVAQAIAAGATEVILLGALGGERLDHETANLLLLADPGYDGIRLEARQLPQAVELDGRHVRRRDRRANLRQNLPRPLVDGQIECGELRDILRPVAIDS